MQDSPISAGFIFHSDMMPVSPEFVASGISTLSKSAKSKATDFALVLLLLCLSGNMLFIAQDRLAYSLLPSAALLFILLIIRGRRFTKRFLAVSIGFLVVFAGQAAIFSFLPVETIGGFFIKLFIAYAVLRLVDDFPRTYVYAMAVIALLSFIFYVPDRLFYLLGLDMRELFTPLSDLLNIQTTGVNERINIGIYNFQTGEHAWRNAAFFWEPGAFSGYLMLAVIFLSICRHRMSDKSARIILFILVAALLTTQSTTGIITLPLALMLFMKFDFSKHRAKIRSGLRLMIGIVALLIFAFALSRLDFVGQKLASLYERGVNQEAGWQLSRFGAMIFDWPYIQKHPLVGWGQNNATQYMLNPELDRFDLGNGMTGFARQLGLLGVSVFLFALWIGLRRYGLSKLRSSYCILLVLLILNGEYFLSYPLFLGLHFLMQSKQTIERQAFFKISKECSLSRGGM